MLSYPKNVIMVFSEPNAAIRSSFVRKQKCLWQWIRYGRTKNKKVQKEAMTINILTIKNQQNGVTFWRCIDLTTGQPLNCPGFSSRRGKRPELAIYSTQACSLQYESSPSPAHSFLTLILNLLFSEERSDATYES